MARRLITPIQKLRVVSAADINCPFHDPMKAGSSGVEICMKPNAQLAASKKKTKQNGALCSGGRVYFYIGVYYGIGFKACQLTAKYTQLHTHFYPKLN